MSKPRITVLLGDRNGIGPELVAKLLCDDVVCEAATILVLGDPAVLQEGEAAANCRAKAGAYTITDFSPVKDLQTTPGAVSEGAGREMLECLSKAAKDVVAGISDGVLFAPLNKEAMHLGGLKQEDEMRFIAGELAFEGTIGELNVLDGLWTTRVTSHIPLKDVAAKISTNAVFKSICFANETLLSTGFDTPRIAVAALNPHAGDGGNFGREEIDVISPAVGQARAQGISADGPFSSDTVFVRARDGHYDGVVTMYHDQGQIAMKLMGFGRGVTVLGGLPVPITTCGHGTGYDIVGQGIAKDAAIRNAFRICCDMAEGLRST